jgi:hypothetical protein
MFKVCKNCDKKFTSIKMCRIHIEKRICLKIIEKKWQKIKKNMKICEKCGLVLSNQYSLDKHLTKQVSCTKKELNLSLFDLQKEFLEKDKIGRKKFLLKKEVLCEKIGIDANQSISLISLTEKPVIKCNENSNDMLEDCSNEELLIILKEKIKTINKISGWVDTAWELLKELSPENIKFEEVSNIIENNDILPDEELEITNIIPLLLQDKDIILDINLTLNDIIPKTILKEQKEWNSIVNDDYSPLCNELNGYWNTDNFIIKPVRHYSDYYNRSLLVRNMRSAKMLSSIICPHFYFNYKSSLDTKVYINSNKKKRMWLLDDNNKWNDVPFSIGIKNMIFHAVSAYTDIIRREKELLPDDIISSWEAEKVSLENCNSENYKLVYKNLVLRIPNLSRSPEEEEKRLINDYLNLDEYRIDMLTNLSDEYPKYSNLPINIQNSLLYQKIIHNIRFQNKIKNAKMYHSDVNKYYNSIN